MPPRTQTMRSRPQARHPPSDTRRRSSAKPVNPPGLRVLHARAHQLRYCASRPTCAAPLLSPLLVTCAPPHERKPSLSPVSFAFLVRCHGCQRRFAHVDAMVHQPLPSLHEAED